jgi:hypothetical protein
MGTTPSFYINSPVSGTQYWATMGYGIVFAAADGVTVHVKAWSGANGTGSGVTCTTLDGWVWDQTTNASVGHFQGSSVITVTANRTGGSANDWLKASAKYTGSGVGSLEIWLTYTSSTAFVPTTPTFSPSAGGIGTSVTLTGTHFTDATLVHLNGVNCPSFTVNSDTSITVTVPSGATTGPFLVGNPSGNSSNSASNFLVANAYVYRTGVWTPALVQIYRSSAWSSAQRVAIERSAAWSDAQ